ncbi:MAG TPA: hypothetical protein VK548_00550 [Candidatus Acidoferrum sp.]|nr:hypothetical protein [Candidatus Acidoferrum sp.]
MARLYLTVLVLFLLPAVVFKGGARLMSMVSGPHTVAGQKPLNQRWLGYNAEAVAGYWKALGEAGRLAAEPRFLELDLVFPTLYGTAFAVSLLTASAKLGCPLHVAWVIAPVVVTVIADWVENLVQLDQLRDYIKSDKKDVTALDPKWIRLASTATSVKLIFFVISSLALIVLLYMLLRSPGAVVA